MNGWRDNCISLGGLLRINTNSTRIAGWLRKQQTLMSGAIKGMESNVIHMRDPEFEMERETTGATKIISGQNKWDRVKKRLEWLSFWCVRRDTSMETFMQQLTYIKECNLGKKENTLIVLHLKDII